MKKVLLNIARVSGTIVFTIIMKWIFILGLEESYNNFSLGYHTSGWVFALFTLATLIAYIKLVPKIWK